MNNELIMIFVTFVIGVIGIFAQRRVKNMLAKGLKAEATIVRNETRRRGSGGTEFYYPVVEFVTANQQRVVQELGIGYKPAKKVGKKIQVIYEADHPSIVEANSFLQLVIVPWGALIVGFGACITFTLDYFDVIQIHWFH